MVQRENSVSVSVPLTPTRSDLYWRRIFNKYDHDKDGRIPYTELKSIIESREYEHDIPDAAVEKIMKLSDRDNSGYLELAEFVEMMRRPELKALLGHFVARYVHCLIAPRSPVETTARGSLSADHLPSLRTLSQVIEAKRNVHSVMLLYRCLVSMYKYILSNHGQGGHSKSKRSGWCTTATVLPLSTDSTRAALPQHGPRVTTVAVVSSATARTTWEDLCLGDGSYEAEYTCWPPPLGMVLVSLAQIVTYCADAVQGKTDATGPVASILIYNPPRRYEAWRFLTYMFVHGGTWHLLVNLLVQLGLGVPLEMVHRWWRVMLVYLAGVVAGSLATSLTNPNAYLAGASAGGYALVAATLATTIMNWKQMDYALGQVLWFIPLLCLDIGIAVCQRYIPIINRIHIAYMAHLAGGVAGLLVGIGVLRNLEVETWEKILWWAAVVLYVVLMVAAILANMLWTSHFIPR